MTKAKLPELRHVCCRCVRRKKAQKRKEGERENMFDECWQFNLRLQNLILNSLFREFCSLSISFLSHSIVVYSVRTCVNNCLTFNVTPRHVSWRRQQQRQQKQHFYSDTAPWHCLPSHRARKATQEKTIEKKWENKKFFIKLWIQFAHLRNLYKRVTKKNAGKWAKL